MLLLFIIIIISYEMSEMVIAGNIIRHRGIYVARAIWFVFSKLLKICFFKFPISQRNTNKASISLSINLTVRLQRFSIILSSLNNSCMHNIINV